MKQFVASDEGIEYMFTVHDLGTNPELFLPLKFFFPCRLNEFLKAILHMACFRMNQMQPVCFRTCSSFAIKSPSACQTVLPPRLLQSSPKLGNHTRLCQWAVPVRARERYQRDRERGARLAIDEKQGKQPWNCHSTFRGTHGNQQMCIVNTTDRQVYRQMNTWMDRNIGSCVWQSTHDVVRGLGLHNNVQHYLWCRALLSHCTVAWYHKENSKGEWQRRPNCVHSLWRPPHHIQGGNRFPFPHRSSPVLG